MIEKISNTFKSEIDRIDSFSADERYRLLLGTLRFMMIGNKDYSECKKKFAKCNNNEIPEIIRELLGKYWNQRENLSKSVREIYKDREPLNSIQEPNISSEDLYWLVCSSMEKSDFCLAMNECISGIFDECVYPINKGKGEKEAEIERYQENVGKYVLNAPVMEDLGKDLGKFDDLMATIEKKKQIALEEIEEWSKS